jgi:hypothetical protein
MACLPSVDPPKNCNLAVIFEFAVVANINETHFEHSRNHLLEKVAKIQCQWAFVAALAKVLKEMV